MLASRETETALLDNLGCEEGYLKYESTTSGAVTSVETYDSGTLSMRMTENDLMIGL